MMERVCVYCNNPNDIQDLSSVPLGDVLVFLMRHNGATKCALVDTALQMLKESDTSDNDNVNKNEKCSCLSQMLIHPKLTDMKWCTETAEALFARKSVSEERIPCSQCLRLHISDEEMLEYLLNKLETNRDEVKREMRAMS
jgi:excinuclease UvrABC ATPase subunit